MIHTVKIDDSTINGKKLMKEVRRYKKGVIIENSFDIPEGYVTADEFAKQVKEELRQKLEQNGYFQ